MAVKEAAELAAALQRTQERVRKLDQELEEARAAVLRTLAERPEQTIDELAEQLHVDGDVLLTLVQTLRDVLGDRALDAETARRAALLAAASQAWRDELGPLLSSADVADLLGVSRQRVDERLRAGRLIGLRDRAGRRWFPGYQFHDGRPLEDLIAAYHTVAHAAVSDWTAAAWAAAADEELDGLSPADWARAGRDSERLAAIAQQDAARLAQ
jgi:hypothetical protein